MIPMRRRTTLLVISLLALPLIAACGGDSDPQTSPSGASISGNPSSIPVTELDLPIRVAVTMPLFEEFVREMGKDNIEVISLVPPGADPHTYELTEEDISRLQGIDFFFVNGLGLDQQIADVIELNRDEDAYVIPFAPNIRSPQGAAQGNPELTADRAGDNAHLWLDPNLAFVYPEIIADEFVIYDGVRKASYDENFRAYRDRIIALREEIKTTLAAIPTEKRKIVIHHDSFAHFARVFELEVAAFIVEAPGDDPPAAAVDAAVQAVRDQQIPAVFAEFGYPDAAMSTIATTAAVELCTLYSDIIPESIDTYEEMMRANADELVRCLGD